MPRVEIDGIEVAGTLNVGTLIEGLPNDGMFIDGMLTVGTPAEGLLINGRLGTFVAAPVGGTDGLLTPDGPFPVGALNGGKPTSGILEGGEPSGGMIAAGGWRLGGLEAEAKDNASDTHKRSMTSPSASCITVPVTPPVLFRFGT